MPKLRAIDLAWPICRYPFGSGGKRVTIAAYFLASRSVRTMSRMKSRPASAGIGSDVILVSCSGINKLSAKSHHLKEGFSYTYILLYTPRPAAQPSFEFMTDQIITRFAPSPTGFLHIGGARTALFNWLYARGRGGKMLLRIEDTDRERSTEAAIAAILDGLKWLGIGWDGDVIYQFARSARHREVAEQLLATGHAYHC